MSQTTEEKLAIAKKVSESLGKSRALIKPEEKKEVHPEIKTEVKTEITPEVTKTEAPKVETTQAATTKVEAVKEVTGTATTVKKEAPVISLFKDLGKKTEEDLTGGAKRKLEGATNRLTGKDEVKDEDLSEEMDPETRKELADVKASGIVEFADLIFMFLCMWISGEWGKAAQEKYTMTDKRKNVLKKLIMRVILTSTKKKINPVGSIVLVALGSALPMIILAIWERISKKRAAKEQAEQLTALQLERMELEELKKELIILRQNGGPVQQQTFNGKTEEIKPVQQPVDKFETITAQPKVEEVKKEVVIQPAVNFEALTAEVKDETKKETVNPGAQFKPEFLVKGRKAKANGQHKKNCLYHLNAHYCNCGKY